MKETHCDSYIFSSLQRIVNRENPSYSAMLNIAESVPLPESIPPIPELEQTKTPSDSGINSNNSEEFRNHFYRFRPIPISIPPIPRNSARFRNRLCFALLPLLLLIIATDSGADFPELVSTRNQTELDGIGCNSAEFRPILELQESQAIPEFRTGIAFSHHPHI